MCERACCTPRLFSPGPAPLNFHQTQLYLGMMQPEAADFLVGKKQAQPFSDIEAYPMGITHDPRRPCFLRDSFQSSLNMLACYGVSLYWLRMTAAKHRVN